MKLVNIEKKKEIKTGTLLEPVQSIEKTYTEAEVAQLLKLATEQKGAEANGQRQ